MLLRVQKQILCFWIFYPQRDDDSNLTFHALCAGCLFGKIENEFGEYVPSSTLARGGPPYVSKI